MGMSIVRLKSSEDIHLLADGLNFKIVSINEGSTDTITESNSRRIISILNGGIETEKIIARIRAGEKLDRIDKTVSISLHGSEYSNTNFMILNVVVNDIDRATWTGNVLRDEGTIHLPVGVLRDILSYLIDIGIKAKQRPYYIIKYVEKLPITSRTDIAWVLTKDFEDKPVGSAWRWDGEKWCPIEDIDDETDPDEGGGGEGSGGNFIISVEEPENFTPGTIWGRIDRT